MLLEEELASIMFASRQSAAYKVKQISNPNVNPNQAYAKAKWSFLPTIETKHLSQICWASSSKCTSPAWYTTDVASI
jgi:hypothetical protein